jgi:cyclopropane fatty-acyl-phospholipid synthase-like methyltransferase
MAEWFEEWFNTEEYLDVYLHRNKADAEKLVSLILKNIELQPEANVIDLACGTGRHSILFAEKGFNVTAVDLSENLLNVARKTAREQKLKIEFVNADLRKFCIASKYDLAINLFTSFGYFEDEEENLSFFSEAFELLNNKGYFIIDFFNTNFIRQNLIPYSEDLINGQKIIQERKIVGNRVVKKILITKNGTRKNFMESVRMYSDRDLISTIQNNNFRIEKVFGDYNGSKFDLNSSPRIIIISSK